MDPTACWNEMTDAFKNNDHETVVERADDLLAWLDKGGFPPAVEGFSRQEIINRTRARRRIATTILQAMEEA